MLRDPLAAHREAVFSLTELVEAANALLPTYLPKDASGRAAEDVNPRLVRFYTTEGLMPDALREGREARYTFEHLVNLLVVRKLLAEGFGSGAIRSALAGQDAERVAALLEGEVQVQLVPRGTSGPGDAAKAAFLRAVRARAGLEGAGPAGKAAAASTPAAPRTDGGQDADGQRPASMRRAHEAPKPSPAAGSDLPTSWTRVNVMDGLELFVRDDFVMPTTLWGDDALLQTVRIVLLQVEQSRKRRK